MFHLLPIPLFPVQIDAPILSICLATYNASHLLRVTLGAVLPQVAAAAGRVELLVVDDASSDDTATVVEEFRMRGPLRYIRNEYNLGTNANLVHGPSQHAAGRYIWVWNQHCLIRPGALERLLAVLEAHPNLDVFYANFRCASYPEDWPGDACGGYDGPFHYLSNPDIEDRAVPQWRDLLDAKTCVCTQSYAHIAKREIWSTYWANHAVGESFRNALSSYPHTYMLVESVFNQPSFYIGTPLITIYNGAQSWGALKSRSKVYLQGYPELILLMKQRGWRGQGLTAAMLWGTDQVGRVVLQALVEKRRDVLLMLPTYLWNYGLHSGAIQALWTAFLESRCCALSRAIVQGRHRLKVVKNYLLYFCRPARWYWARRRKMADSATLRMDGNDPKSPPTP